MQIIIPFQGDPEDYVRDQAHRKVDRPEICPNCQGLGQIARHGYYDRYVSESEGPASILIRVRRFLCHLCRRTASMLPDFAQPHKLVATDTVSQYLGGSKSDKGVVAWEGILETYEIRFAEKLPETREALSLAYTDMDLPDAAACLWTSACRYFGNARQFTAHFARNLGMTVFGVYKCHHPMGNLQKNTPVSFSGARDPP